MSFLRQLRLTNTSRCGRWHGPGTEPWSSADWSNAMCGEAGEAANVVKKIRRHETRTGSADLPDLSVLYAKLAEELADTVIYADLVAAHYGLDLQAAITEKFNVVSEREDFPERLYDGAEILLGDEEREFLADLVEVHEFGNAPEGIDARGLVARLQP